MASYTINNLNYLCHNMLEWQQVFDKKLSALELHSNYINSSDVVLEALGIIGNYIYQVNHPNCNEFFQKTKRFRMVS